MTFTDNLVTDKYATGIDEKTIKAYIDGYDMTNSLDMSKLATDCGYAPTFHYNPEEERLYIDSKEPNFDRYEEFLNNEVRYKSLKIKDKDLADKLLSMQKENAIKRYNY